MEKRKLKIDPTWLPYELRWHKYKKCILRDKAYIDPLVKKYACKPMVRIKEANDAIYDAIKSGEPFMVARVGGSEMKLIAYTYRNRYFPFRTDARADYLRNLCNLSGFFPNEIEYGERFTDMMSDVVGNTDVMGVWFNYMEEWFVNKFASKCDATWLANLEPWIAVDADSNIKPWTQALEGKKVLIVHPFEDSIRSQYEKHGEQIFTGEFDGLLPKFELKTVKAVQSLGGIADGYTDWFEALQDMQEKIDATDYDVAILGCGAYGLPLASHIKDMGKCAIHLGGVTQLLFGIQGKRWDDTGDVYARMVNDNWIRPNGEEVTEILKKVEEGCYC